MFDRRRRHRARGSGLCLRQSGLMQGDEETRQRVENIHCKYTVLRLVQRRWMQRISVVEVIDGGDYFHHICHVSVHCSIEHTLADFQHDIIVQYYFTYHSYRFVFSYHFHRVVPDAIFCFVCYCSKLLAIILQLKMGMFSLVFKIPKRSVA